VLISAIGSTTGITTVEYEPGLVEHDIAEMLNKLAPYGVNYEHNKTWGDDNGAAHLRSTLIGTSQTIPFENGKLILGTWQQIIFMDFDTRPRNREIVVQITGE
jgi:secondary thiamine-phosphate synthase enzyme